MSKKGGGKRRRRRKGRRKRLMEEVLQFGLERLTQRRRAQLSAPHNET